MSSYDEGCIRLRLEHKISSELRFSVSPPCFFIDLISLLRFHSLEESLRTRRLILLKNKTRKYSKKLYLEREAIPKKLPPYILKHLSSIISFKSCSTYSFVGRIRVPIAGHDIKSRGSSIAGDRRGSPNGRSLPMICSEAPDSS